uniref:Gustatory receptor n=1 Tax=Anopheles dirus TaxID=7168 RepID=A0A182NR19_9DIPT
MSPWLKYWFNIGSFFETIQPNVRVLRWCGLFPFSVSRSPAKTLRSEVKFIDIVIFTLWQSFFLQMFYAAWPRVFFEIPVSRIMTLITLMLYLLGGVNCSVSGALVLLLRKRFVRMVQLVEEADQVFDRLFGAIQHSKIHLVSVALLLGSFLVQVLLLVSDGVVGKTLINTTRVPQNNRLQAAFYYYYVIRTLHITAVTIFIAGLYGFRERLRALNEQLRVCFLEKRAPEQLPEVANEMVRRIQGLMEIYSQLCDAIRIFCTIFVWQPVIFCASLIVSAVFAVLAIGHILSNPVPIVLAITIVYTTITVLYASLFLFLVKLGNDLKKEGKQTAVLVHKAINQSSKTPAVVERLLLFSRHLQHQMPVVSCGLFCFDWTLALSVGRGSVIISALATYSVILIQFELGVPRFFINAMLHMYADGNTKDP